MHLKESPAKRRPFCLCLNALQYQVPELPKILCSNIQPNFNQNTRLFICVNALEKSSAKWWPFWPVEDELNKETMMLISHHCNDMSRNPGNITQVQDDLLSQSHWPIVPITQSCSNFLPTRIPKWQQGLMPAGMRRYDDEILRTLFGSLGSVLLHLVSSSSECFRGFNSLAPGRS